MWYEGVRVCGMRVCAVWYEGVWYEGVWCEGVWYEGDPKYKWLLYRTVTPTRSPVSSPITTTLLGLIMECHEILAQWWALSAKSRGPTPETRGFPFSSTAVQGWGAQGPSWYWTPC